MLKELMDALRKPFPKEAHGWIEEKDITYLSSEAVRQRLDEVTGYMYEESYSPVEQKTVSTNDGKQLEYLSTCCTLSLLDTEHGSIMKTCSCPGGDFVSKTKDGKVINIGNDIDNACQDAFKRCCKRFGISSEFVGKGNPLQIPSKKRGNNRGTTNGTGSNDSSTYAIRFVGNFYTKGTTGGYGAKIACGTDSGELVVWKEFVDAFCTQFNDPNWATLDWVGYELKIHAEESFYKGTKQLVFASFA